MVPPPHTKPFYLFIYFWGGAFFILSLQDCELAPWTEWSGCSGCRGQKRRHRSIMKLPEVGCGSRCLSPL